MVSEIKTPASEEGFLIRSIDYGDNHRIVNFFTKGKGRLDLIALGAKKSQKRFSGLLDYFNQLHLFYRTNPRGSLGRLEEVQLIRPFSGIREDYEKSMVGLGWIKFLREVLREGACLPALYDLFKLALRHLEVEPTSWVDVVFRRHALGYLGYELTLDRCVRCESNQKDGGIFFPQRGGILCQDCGGKGNQVFYPKKFWEWEAAGDVQKPERLASARKLLDEAFREYLEN